MKKPNFFILGAGKCGTTSLYFYLKQHPEIYLSPIKEPTFFCEEFQVVKNPIKYFNLFELAKNEKIIGEASHAYLSSPASANVLKALFPEAKFVVILRNPADRAYSLYHHMRGHGYEAITTFEKALKAEDARFLSPNFNRTCPQYFYNFLYFRSGLYGEQLERYYRLFDEDKIHVLTLNELETDPHGSVRGIFNFLGVNPDFTPEITFHNVGKFTARIPFIQYFWKTKVFPMLGWAKFQDLQKTGVNLLRKTNFTQIPQMNNDTRNQLFKRYKDDLDILFDLAGVRLE